MIFLVPIELALVSQVFFCRINDTIDFTQCKVGGLSGALECSCPLAPFPSVLIFVLLFAYGLQVQTYALEG